MLGTGTVVAQPPPSTAAERARLLEREVEQLAVEAKRLGMSLADVTESLAEHWRRLEKRKSNAPFRTYDLTKVFAARPYWTLSRSMCPRAVFTDWWGRTARARPPPSRC